LLNFNFLRLAKSFVTQLIPLVISKEDIQDLYLSNYWIIKKRRERERIKNDFL